MTLARLFLFLFLGAVPLSAYCKAPESRVEQVEIHVIDKWWQVDAMIVTASLQAQYMEGNEEVEMTNSRTQASIACWERYSGKERPVVVPSPPCVPDRGDPPITGGMGYDYETQFHYFVILAYSESSGWGYPATFVTDPTTWDEFEDGKYLVEVRTGDEELITNIIREIE